MRSTRIAYMAPGGSDYVRSRVQHHEDAGVYYGPPLSVIMNEANTVKRARGWGDVHVYIATCASIKLVNETLQEYIAFGDSGFGASSARQAVAAAGWDPVSHVITVGDDVFAGGASNHRWDVGLAVWVEDGDVGIARAERSVAERYMSIVGGADPLELLSSIRCVDQMSALYKVDGVSSCALCLARRTRACQVLSAVSS